MREKRLHGQVCKKATFRGKIHKESSPLRAVQTFPSITFYTHNMLNLIFDLSSWLLLMFKGSRIGLIFKNASTFLADFCFSIARHFRKAWQFLGCSMGSCNGVRTNQLSLPICQPWQQWRIQIWE